MSQLSVSLGCAKRIREWMINCPHAEVVLLEETPLMFKNPATILCLETEGQQCIVVGGEMCPNDLYSSMDTLEMLYGRVRRGLHIGNFLWWEIRSVEKEVGKMRDP